MSAEEHDPSPEDPELILLDRILRESRDVIFPLSEPEITASDADVARLLTAIGEQQHRGRKSILRFPEKKLALAASLFYLAGAGFLYVIQRASHPSGTLAGDTRGPVDFLGHTARVSVPANDGPPAWSYVLTAAVFITATGLLLLWLKKAVLRRSAASRKPLD